MSKQSDKRDNNYNQRDNMSETIAYSTVTKEIFRSTNNEFDIIGLMEGSTAYANGVKYVFTKEAIEKNAASYSIKDANADYPKGYININHNHDPRFANEGVILSSVGIGYLNHSDQSEKKLAVQMRIRINRYDTVQLMKSRYFTGHSQECRLLKVDSDNNILEFDGLGLSLLFAVTPACSPEQGCTIINSMITSSEHLPWDECIKKVMKEGHTKEEAENICGWIKNRNSSQNFNVSSTIANPNFNTDSNIHINTNNTDSNIHPNINPNITVIPNTETSTSTSISKACPRKDNKTRGVKEESKIEVNKLTEEKIKELQSEIEKLTSQLKKVKSEAEEDEKKLKKDKEEKEDMCSKLKTESGALKADISKLTSEKVALETKVKEQESATSAMKTALDSATSKLSEIELTAKKERVTKILSMSQAQDEKVLMSMDMNGLKILEDAISKLQESRGPLFNANAPTQSSNPFKTVGNINPLTGKWE